MSEKLIRPATADVFSRLSIALLLAIGVLGFAGSMLLGAFASDFRSGRNAGAHALSNAATGFAGIVELTQATRRNPRILRSEQAWDTEDLVIATPELASVDIGRLLAARRGRATLIVLPKWETAADDKVEGWVNMVGLLSASQPAGVLAPQTTLAVDRKPSGGRPLRPVAWAPPSLKVAAPRPLQSVRSPALTPLITDNEGRIVLGQLTPSATYVLTDPDLLNNFGIRRLDRARAAVDLLDFVNATGAGGIGFDVTLNGLGHGRSPLRLAFEPPFLPMTLGIVVALALAGWQALMRFGAARPRERAIAFGKTALIDNSALLLRKAGREGALGSRYAAVVRERARLVFGVPSQFQDDEADRYLDALRGSTRFTALVAEAGRAERRTDMLAAAQALHQWQLEKTR